ncbi:MAG: transcription antitermination factor NusB, partial [Thermoanaerobaculia bacterium]
MSERDQALRILERVENDAAPATPQLDSDAVFVRGAAFVRHLVLGVLRWRSRLDYVIEQLAGRKIVSVDPVVRQILRIGIYQLMWMDVAPYAAVSECVAIAKRRVPRASGFVNAVLRRASTSALENIVPAGDGVAGEAVRNGHPPWLLERWIARFGADRALAIVAANQQLSYPDLLVRSDRVPMETLTGRLDERSVPYERSPIFPDMLRLRTGTDAVEKEIEEGLVYPMDEGSVAVARLFPSGMGDVLDLAAAPGGKSLALMARARRVVSHDISWRRLR